MKALQHIKTLVTVGIVVMLLAGCATSGNINQSPGGYPEWVNTVGVAAVSGEAVGVKYASNPSEMTMSLPKPASLKSTAEKLKMHLKVLFDLEKVEINDKYREHLKNIAAIMTDHPSMVITIEGHTCNVGAEQFNLKLSHERAENVKKHLVAYYDIDPARMNIKAFGSAAPVVDNETEEGRQQNRRAVAELIAETTEPVFTENSGSRLVFDHLDKPLNGLTDYSKPKKKIKSKKRKTAKKISSGQSYQKQYSQPARYGYPEKSRGWSGWAGNENINIVVNPADDKEKSKTTHSSVEPLSRIEKRYNQYGELTKGKKIRQFGYDQVRLALRARGQAPGVGEDFIREKKGAPLFSQDEPTRLFSQSKTEEARYYSREYTAMRPVSSEYIIAPGDEVFVKITGPVEIAEVFAVDRNGQLFIPKIGAVNLAGRKASELQSLLAARAKDIFVNASVEASLGRLRSIQVTVSGYVKNPGLIQVTANSSLLNALAAAGGPSKDGTLRDVVLRRRNVAEQHIDLYGILLGGDFRQDPALLPGDMVYVGPVGSTAAVMSPGDAGAIYEIAGNSTLTGLSEKIGLSGSFTDIETVLVERSVSGSDRRIESLDFKQQADTFMLADGDIFQFFPPHPYSYNSVAVSGSVLRPGIYPFSENMRVSNLLHLARGFLVNTSLDRALLIRELGPDSQFNIMPGDSRGSHRKQLIWLDLAKILTGDTEADLTMMRLDRLKIFTTSDQQPQPVVKIIGGVRKPGEYHLTAGMTLGDLLSIAGGPTEKAYDGESSIVRRRHSRDGKRHFDVGIIPFILTDVIERRKPAGILLENQDKIVIRQVNNLEVSARIDGWVQFPGTYILPSGSRIEDLIKLAGGILPGADLRAAVFQRRRVANMQNHRLQNFYASSSERFARSRDEVTLTGHPSESLANQLSLLGQDRLYLNMKQFQTTGRVVIDLATEDFPVTEDNLVLEDGDGLKIPQKMTTVMVMGRIFNPSAYLWKEGLSVDDYLNKSGGWLEDADPDYVHIVMANGEVKSAAQKGGKDKLLAFHPGPGDIIFVPQEPLGRSTMAQVMDVLQILRMTAETGAIGAALPNMHNATPSIELGTGNYQQRTIVDAYRPELYENFPQGLQTREAQDE